MSVGAASWPGVRRLGGLLRGDGRHGVVEVLQRTLQLLVDLLLLGQRRWRHARQLRARTRRPGALLGALGGEPGGAERLGSLGATCNHEQGDDLRQRFQPRQAAIERNGDGDDGTNGRDGMTRDSLGVFNSTRRLANAHSL